MSYHVLAAIFFLSIFLVLALALLVLVKRDYWKKSRRMIGAFYVLWFCSYFFFIVFCTGPTNLESYPSPQLSEFKLPWVSGVSRFVAQGNRSFTSHRGLHKYAWDFAMPNGTEVLASRSGIVDEVVDSFDGVGFSSNYIHIKHRDGTFSGYAHIRKKSSFVKRGESVQQGQPIALSGMVGETIMPHLHFYVLNSTKSASVPISFNEVEGGIVYAGRFYKSKNKKFKKP